MHSMVAGLFAIFAGASWVAVVLALDGVRGTEGIFFGTTLGLAVLGAGMAAAQLSYHFGLTGWRGWLRSIAFGFVVTLASVLFTAFGLYIIGFATGVQGIPASFGATVFGGLFVMVMIFTFGLPFWIAVVSAIHWVAHRYRGVENPAEAKSIAEIFS